MNARCIAPRPAQAIWTAFDEAVALLDDSDRSLGWTSAAWQRLRPDLGPRSAPVAVATALPGLAAALPRLPGAADVAADDPDACASPRSAGRDDSGRLDVSVARLPDGRVAIRLVDRREQGLALQRQLDDRERLLFTSRVLSVGEMATTLAHELNQPIGAAASLLRGLRSRVARREAALAAEEAAALDRAIDQVMFAARVIARIRDFTRSHRPRLARLDLATLLRTSAALLDWDLQRAGVVVSLHGLDRAAEVRGDAVMLQQVVVNLMRNALDALRGAPPPARPRLALRLLVGPGEAELQVGDNGCGLDEATAANLFVPFASSKPTGMGIGLSICRSFVELHQGRLWFSRNADRGTTFHVALPLEAPQPTQEQP